ncbi:SIR2 family NAD-dependent protein deacylase [Nitrincola iocasae]|uniref:protein acetyllysine N-acetyltransferase n=1 Tax=Nitrincola iocasae TaxID=2614693 RepID=A0A5J6LBJ6_9GAMM|nr:Sir2 family NAD-dependent protein deacetylase [Nitrincola iocasae]QEW05903.1 hypothetical protein F5I99_05035 [Nitrincola iocasae]
MLDTQSIERAAAYLRSAKRLVILAGAGMSADSGLLTFRDATGYWKSDDRNQFSLASYSLFEKEPRASWKFYAKRIRQYRLTKPHPGYEILHKWCTRVGSHRSFVLTSNTDGHFLKSGFNPDQVYECHGSLESMYCSDKHCDTRKIGLMSITDDQLNLIEDGILPKCGCGQVLRPHVLMFGDRSFLHHADEKAYLNWQSFEKHLASSRDFLVLEIGVGSTVTTLEDKTWALAKQALAVLQINICKAAPNDSPCPWLNLDGTALTVLESVHEEMNKYADDQ